MQLRLQNFIQYNFNLSFFRIFFEQSLEGLMFHYVPHPLGSARYTLKSDTWHNFAIDCTKKEA